MMKRGAVLTVLAIVIVALGFYRGWFALSSPASDAGSNKVKVSLTVDPDKVKQDAETVKEKTTELTGQAKKEIHGLGDQAKDSK